VKRPKKFDERGHDPKPGKIVKAIECSRCCDVRLKCNPWSRPCSVSAADRAERESMASAP
jgi:hypothetical protein